VSRTKAIVGKAPAFQWYPGDHRRDTAVQACSFEARALWREMLDLMHDGEPRGFLTAGGVPIDEAALSRMVGAQLAPVKRWLRELEQRKVFSRTEAGVIYSRRMVKDEHISEVRRNAGKLGGNPDLVNQTGSKTEANGNHTGEQKPTPATAICDLRSAVASFSLELLPESSKKRSDNSKLALAPLADARVAALLEPIWEAFARRFYATASGHRLGEVARQILATLSDQGAHLGKRQYVRAGSAERLIAKMRETMGEAVRDPDKAIRVLLLKLGDTSDGSAPGVAAAEAIKSEERTTEADVAAAERWLEKHPELVPEIEQQLDYRGLLADDGDDYSRQVRAMARTALVVAAWRDRPPDARPHASG
jgi:hypothetical protein